MTPVTREGGQTSHSMKFNLMAYAGYRTYIQILAARRSFVALVVSSIVVQRHGSCAATGCDLVDGTLCSAAQETAN
jgi:hypothetical protein